MADDDLMQLTKAVQKGLMCPGQLQLLMKMQDYRTFFLRKDGRVEKR